MISKISMTERKQGINNNHRQKNVSFGIEYGKNFQQFIANNIDDVSSGVSRAIKDAQKIAPDVTMEYENVGYNHYHRHWVRALWLRITGRKDYAYRSSHCNQDQSYINVDLKDALKPENILKGIKDAIANDEKIKAEEIKKLEQANAKALEKAKKVQEKNDKLKGLFG